MIKIEKDISNIPISLRIPIEENFEGNIPSPPKTTHKRRKEVIEKKRYIDENKFNNRYKIEDIRIELKKIYKNKCAFCEQKIEQYHIEHYRPKKEYYWLAFSWDNLLMACATCNENKGTHFELEGAKTSFRNTTSNIKKINECSVEYDVREKPKMVNPEITDPLGEINFKKNGVIESDNIRFEYTIEKCQIDRKPLNDARRKLLNDFENDIRSELTLNKDITQQNIIIGTLTRKFIRDFKNKENPFLAFRDYTITNDWLNDIVKKVKKS